MHATSAGEASGEPGLRERKKARTRASIYEAAVALFRNRGYDDTTVEEIARRAGVSRATVFNYFGSKRALLLEYRRRLDDELRDLERRLLDPDPEEDSVRGRVERYFGELAELAEREGALYRSMVRQVLTQVSRLEDADRERAERVAISLAEALREGSRCGELDPDLDAELAAYTLLRLWTSALVEWTNTEGRTPLPERVGEMVRLLFEGLGAGREPAKP